MEKVTGIAAERVLPPFARTRFSTWFRRRHQPAAGAVGREQGRVAIFSTCMVEYQDPAIGQAMVGVYEHNGISCSLPEGQVCCGAPWLHQGDVDTFVAQGRKNVAVLAQAVRAGNDVVVPQPTCGYILKKDYVDYIGGPDAELVAANTYDSAEYLMKVHKAEGTELSREFPGEVPASVTYHAPCHLRAQNIGLRSRDLLKLTGAKVAVVAECSAIDGTWGYRAENFDMSRKIARKLTKALERAGGDAVAGDCRLANGGILQETGTLPQHPMQVMARAYGLDDPDA
jgi:glycerol-3-phosphate dehydrogenase subunit C